MAGLVPAIHGDRLVLPFQSLRGRLGVDARDEPGHDERERHPMTVESAYAAGRRPARPSSSARPTTTQHSPISRMEMAAAAGKSEPASEILL